MFLPVRNGACGGSLLATDVVGKQASGHRVQGVRVLLPATHPPDPALSSKPHAIPVSQIRMYVNESPSKCVNTTARLRFYHYCSFFCVAISIPVLSHLILFQQYIQANICAWQSASRAQLPSARTREAPRPPTVSAPQVQTLNPAPLTPNPAPEIRNPKPYTPTPKSEATNPSNHPPLHHPERVGTCLTQPKFCRISCTLEIGGF